jgi:hypothetical protein
MPRGTVRAPQLCVPALVADLATRPGEWAEVYRYPLARIRSAYSRGSETCARYPVLEYVVTREEAEAVLRFRHLPFTPASVYVGHTTDTEEHQP